MERPSWAAEPSRFQGSLLLGFERCTGSQISNGCRVLDVEGGFDEDSPVAPITTAA